MASQLLVSSTTAGTVTVTVTVTPPRAPTPSLRAQHRASDDVLQLRREILTFALSSQQQQQQQLLLLFEATICQLVNITACTVQIPRAQQAQPCPLCRHHIHEASAAKYESE